MTSQCRAICSQSTKIVKFVKFGPLIFLNCESTCDLTDVAASIYDRKMDARPFDTTNDILRCLSYVQSLSKTGMRQYGASETDGLKRDFFFIYNNIKLELTIIYQLEWHAEKTRQWVDDTSVTSCPKCDVEFSMMRRRHHCRQCGGIFCWQCSDQGCKMRLIFRKRVKNHNL